MTSKVTVPSDTIDEAAINFNNPYQNVYDFVYVERVIKVGNTHHHKTIQCYSSGPYLADLIDGWNKTNNAIEDIFYDYKDDEDLNFDMYMKDSESAKALYSYIIKSGVHDLVAFTERDNTNIVTVEVKALFDKNSFVAALRRLKYNPNGG